jgi:hypothetical protein
MVVESALAITRATAVVQELPFTTIRPEEQSLKVLEAVEESAAVVAMVAVERTMSEETVDPVARLTAGLVVLEVEAQEPRLMARKEAQPVGELEALAPTSEAPMDSSPSTTMGLYDAPSV